LAELLGLPGQLMNEETKKNNKLNTETYTVKGLVIQGRRPSAP
jgi:hypothetical protein